jgi:hypothetical protein
MAKDIPIDMVPDISLLDKIGATNFTLPEAIVELVANSIDARADGLALEVDIDVQPEHVMVIDNAQGMKAEVLAEAVRLGVEMDRFVQRGERKGMYGLGMKTACASMGRVWEIHTRPIGENVEYRVTFDLDAFRRRVNEGARAWKHTIQESKPDKKGPLGDRKHGTAIIVRNLRDPNPMDGAVLNHLGRAYGPHIDAGDKFRVRGTEAKSPTYNLIEKSKTPIDEACGPNQEYHITGWVGLDKKTHNDDFFGLNLFRKGQLIEAWRKAPFFRVHLMTSKIVGELHLDFVPVNFNKRGFNEQSREWKLATAHMAPIMKHFVRASETSIKGKKDATREARAVQGLQMAMGVQDDIAPMIDAVLAKSDGGESPAIARERPKSHEVRVDATTIHLPDGPMSVTYVIADMGDEETPWSPIFEEEKRELQAVLNSSSRLFLEVNDQKFLGILALSDTVAQYLVSARGFSSEEARRIRNKWLYAALGRKT